VATTQSSTVTTETDRSRLDGFVAAAESALASAAWAQCTNTPRAFTVGAPAGFFAATPRPATADEWTALGASLADTPCRLFHFVPLSISPGTDSGADAAVVLGLNFSPATYAQLAPEVGVDKADRDYLTRSERTVAGKPAVCATSVDLQPGLGTTVDTFHADCYIDRDNRIFSIGVKVQPVVQIRREVVDGRVVSSRTTPVAPVPESARALATALLDRLLETLRFG
jgi:hypothetical protein